MELFGFVFNKIREIELTNINNQQNTSEKDIQDCIYDIV